MIDCIASYIANYFVAGYVESLLKDIAIYIVSYIATAC